MLLRGVFLFRVGIDLNCVTVFYRGKWINLEIAGRLNISGECCSFKTASLCLGDLAGGLSLHLSLHVTSLASLTCMYEFNQYFASSINDSASDLGPLIIPSQIYLILRTDQKHAVSFFDSNLDLSQSSTFHNTHHQFKF